MKRPNNTGLTLIEFLIYFAILLVVLTITIQLTGGMFRVQARQRSVTEVSQNVRFAENRFTQAVHDEDTDAIAIVSGELRLTDNVASPTYYIKRVSASDANGTYGKVQICESATDCNSATYSDITNSKVDVTSLTFTKLTNTNARDSVKMSIVVKYRNANEGDIRYYELNSQLSAGLRPG